MIWKKDATVYVESTGIEILLIRPRNKETGNIGCFMDMYYNMILDMDAIN